MVEMKVEMVKISELKPAEYNPRMATEEDVKQLKKSIEKFGMVDPIIVNSNAGRKNIIIGGHFRYRVAKELGLKEIPVVYIDLDEEKERELNIRLNRNLGHWDFDMLGNTFDLDLLLEYGFKPGELGMANSDGKDLIDRDESMLQKDLDTYTQGDIKQIVLFFKAQDYEAMIERMNSVMKSTQTESYTDAFIKILEHYENTSTDKKAD